MSSKFDDRAARYVTDLIRDFPQLEDFQAAGFPGNFGVETGGFEHVQEINPLGGGRGGLGDAQWTGDRREDFEEYLEKRKSKALSHDPADYAANYGMLFRELDGGEGRRVLPKLLAARDVDEATEIVMREYERPGVPHLDKRKNYGRRALAAFRATGVSVAKLRAQGRPGAEPAKDGEILDPIGKLPATDAIPNEQLIAVFLTLLQRVFTIPAVRALIEPLLRQRLELPVDTAKPPAPPPKPPVTPVMERPSVLAGGLSFVAGLIAQLNGNIAPPIGETATLPGILTTVLPLALTFLGGPLGGMASNLMGAFGSWAAKRAKPS
jgi:hypothetical protein